MLSPAAMNIPTLRGRISRRILVNYRVDPSLAAKLLPPPFRPQIVADSAIAGICLIRLEAIRPCWLPAVAGLSSENAAHRFAVEWDAPEGPRRGVYIPRRDTSSWVNRAAGGRVFPGAHHSARFDVDEQDDRYRVQMKSGDGEVCVRVAACAAADLPADSVFRSLAEATRFFEEGCVGCSDSGREGEFDALEISCSSFRIEPLAVDEVVSSFFDDPRRFPEGAAVFDSAFLMRRIEHEWHGRGRVRAIDLVAKAA
jgi:Uncharacterized conserved protein (COG2071)